MSALDLWGNTIPTGRKLTTWEPYTSAGVLDATRAANLDGSAGDDYLGILIQAGQPNFDANGKDLNKWNKRLIILNAGEDPGEQGGHRVLYHMVAELLSGSQLARSLLSQFAFIYVPFYAQACVRDGRSRFGWDKPVDDNLNGGSTIGYQVCRAAIENWMSDHPRPYPNMAESWSGAAFAGFSLHSDYFDVNYSGAQRLSVPSPSGAPGSPYGSVKFPALDAGLNESVTKFASGFLPKTHREFFDVFGATLTEGNGSVMAAALAPYGGQGFYFEMPWRSPGHKASHWWDEDDLRQTAIATLSGISTAANLADYEGPALDLSGEAALSLVAGLRGVKGPAVALVLSAALSVSTGKKLARGGAFGLSASAVLSSGAGLAAHRGAAASLPATVRLSTVPATGAHRSAASNLSSPVTLTTPAGTSLIVLSCPAESLVGAAALSSAQGYAATHGAAAALAAPVSVSTPSGKKASGGGAVALARAAFLSSAAGKVGRKGSGANLVASAALSLASGVAQGVGGVYDFSGTALSIVARATITRPSGTPTGEVGPPIDEIVVELDAAPAITVHLDTTPVAEVTIDPKPSLTLSVEVAT